MNPLREALSNNHGMESLSTLRSLKLQDFLVSLKRVRVQKVRMVNKILPPAIRFSRGVHPL